MTTATLALLTQLKPGDYIVLAAYFGILLLAGWWTNRRPSTSTEDYFLASRSMPVWAVVLSILSTAQSAATYVGVPQSAYTGNLTYLAANIGGILAAILLATVFIPAYYRHNVTTPYQLLERRFGSTGRVAAASAYLVGRVFASGARVFIAAIPAALVLFGDKDNQWAQAGCVLAFCTLGIALCFFGGVRSVIWIDVLQVTVYIGAAVAAIFFLLSRIPADIPTITHALANPPPINNVTPPSKLTVISTSFDPSAQFTLWTALTGFVLLSVASHGADQDLVQRMLTCKSPAKGAWSVISGILVGVPAVLIFLILGLLLYIFYQRPDIMGVAHAAPATSDSVFQAFALNHMSGGLAGLVIAGLFACGPAGINSGLNAMSSTFVSDIYSRLRPSASPQQQLRIGRMGTVGAGAALAGMGLLCVIWYDPKESTVLDFVLAVMNFAYAGLLGVFFTALFTRRGNGRSVIAALIVGFLVILACQVSAFSLLGRVFPGLLGFASAAEVTPAALRNQFPWLAWAFPWHLCLGAGAAFVTCALGTPPTSATLPPAPPAPAPR
ncbi:MAG: hypothetical protein LW650_05840 [Planctomycetaceae bacterium]|nr:hypothetical protein [Planctomycetaceae bacterium]